MKTATRNKHTPLNQYVSFSQTPAAAGDSETTLDEILPGPSVHDPVNQVIATEELESLVSCLSGVSGVLSDLESRVLSLYLDGHSYEAIAERLECDTKTVDNALQRVKRKVGTHLASREVAGLAPPAADPARTYSSSSRPWSEATATSSALTRTRCSDCIRSTSPSVRRLGKTPA